MKRALLLTTVIFLLAIANQAFGMTSATTLMRFSDLTGKINNNVSGSNSTSDMLSGNILSTNGIHNGGVSSNCPGNRNHDKDICISDGKRQDGTEIVPPPNAVPEPTTLVLLGLGLAGVGLFRRKK